jgi:hypothetical protein
MKNYNGSVLLDALFSFLMLSTLCITLLPLLNISNNKLNDQHNDLELKRVLYNKLIKTPKLPENTNFNQYIIINRDNMICIKKETTNKKVCYQQKS